MEPQTVGYIVLTFRVHGEDGQYASFCEELDIASCGDTIQEAFDNIEDAVLLYLNTIEEQGECERVFAERNIHILPGQPPSEGRISIGARPNEYVSPHMVRIPAGVA